MEGLSLAVAVAAVAVTAFNVLWSVLFQRRQRADEQQRQTEDQQRFEAQQLALDERFRREGPVVELLEIGYSDGMGGLWYQLEVRNTGRAATTIREVGIATHPDGPFYGVYSTDDEPDNPQEGPRLPHRLDPSTAARWTIDARWANERFKTRGPEAEPSLRLVLDTGEEHLAPIGGLWADD